jgi:hypothetical protein
MDLSGQLYAPAALLPGERALGIHCIGGWVDPRTGLDDVEENPYPYRNSISDLSAVHPVEY